MLCSNNKMSALIFVLFAFVSSTQLDIVTVVVLWGGTDWCQGFHVHALTLCTLDRSGRRSITLGSVCIIHELPLLSGQLFSIQIPDEVQSGLHSPSWLLAIDHKRGTQVLNKRRGFMSKPPHWSREHQSPLNWKLTNAWTVRRGRGEMHGWHLLKLSRSGCGLCGKNQAAASDLPIKPQFTANRMPVYTRNPISPEMFESKQQQWRIKSCLPQYKSEIWD